MKEGKTNVMRALEEAGIPYLPVYYDLGDRAFSGAAVAAVTGIPPEQSFKTLAAAGSGFLVFVIPVDAELDLKKAAAAAGVKRVELIPQSRLIPVTGYPRGEVSPVGMKKKYPTYFDETAVLFDDIAVSAGKKGASVRVSPPALAAFLGASFAALTR